MNTAVVSCTGPSHHHQSTKTTHQLCPFSCSKQTEGHSPSVALVSLSGCLLPLTDHHPPLCGAQRQGPKMGGYVAAGDCHLCIFYGSVCDWNQAITNFRREKLSTISTDQKF